MGSVRRRLAPLVTIAIRRVPRKWFCAKLAGREVGDLPTTKQSARVDGSEREPIAETYLRQRLALWQDRLKLEDRKISVVQSHPSSLRPRTLGNTHWDADQQTAVIRVLDASDYQVPLRAALKDMEFTGGA